MSQYSLATSNYPILFVRNFPFTVTSEEIYEIFGQYGAIRQVRLGTDAEAKGTAFVVYETMAAAKEALTKLTGFNVGGRYLVIGYYQPRMLAKRLENVKKAELKKEEDEQHQDQE